MIYNIHPTPGHHLLLFDIPGSILPEEVCECYDIQGFVHKSCTDCRHCGDQQAALFDRCALFLNGKEHLWHRMFYDDEHG
jgi:hypothetical protein